MNIFDQYGIKEVADVTLYSIHKKKDNSGEIYYIPALYFDTLKISSIEKTAENVWAQGGLGNSRLICWDYGKQINVTLEDALCTPASLGLCWGGILSSDWVDGEINHNVGISFNGRNPVERISRIEKAFYPKNDREKSSISYLLPQLEDDAKDTTLGILLKSSIIDGTIISGFGHVRNHSYKWKMILESDIQSVAVVPDRFFDINDKSYPIDITHQVKVNNNVNPNKFNIIYKINSRDTALVPPTGELIIDDLQNDNNLVENKNNVIIEKQSRNEVITYDKNVATFTPPSETDEKIDIEKGAYLCIVVDNNDDYWAYISKDGSTWGEPSTPINLTQFKGIDMWLRFSGINEMIYYLITKYENDISFIGAATIDGNNNTNPTIESDFSLEAKRKEGKLWAYINPKTMTPYSDDYWFHQGEPYYIKSLTLAAKNKKLKSQKINVTAGQFPGMYMLVGETYIRSRDTGEDERMQIKIPLCKVKSDQNITLEAEGEPTVFNVDIEVARPENGIMMELTSYEVAERMIENEQGFIEIKDGSTEVLSE